MVIARLAVLAVLAGVLPQQPASAAAGPEAEGRAVFEARCATCHGADGRGGPGSQTFGFALPDFTDCGFAAREPDADWIAVIHGGGPARGFRPVMPAHGEALSEAEIAAVVAHLRSLCEDDCWPRGELNLPRPLFTEKAFPEDEAVVEVFANANREGDVTVEWLFEKRIGARSQIEISLPVIAREEPGPGSSWTGGAGDLGIGVKHAVFHRLEWGSIASLGAELRLPSGDEDDGLGTGTLVFEPYLAAGQILPLGGFVQLQALGEIPADRDLADEAQLRATLGTQFSPHRFGRALAPMVELIGTFAFEDRVDPQWDLVPQVQITLSQRQHVRLAAGVRVPLTDSGQRPTRVGAYLLWDWFDGGLLEGW